MRKPVKKPIDRKVKQEIAEWEKQAQRDEGLRKTWFRNVLTQDEVVELAAFYCRRVGAQQDISNPETMNNIQRDLKRILFLMEAYKS